MRVFFSRDYAGSGFAFETTRKAGWVADSLVWNPLPGVSLVEPEPVGREVLLEVHGEAYVRAVETGSPKPLAESQWFPWDAGLWPMVRASNGGVVAAALAALEDGVAGSLSSGLHHASRDRGRGYCTFNGLVLAAKAALREGSGPVLILDLDAHCGGGTAALIEGEAGIRQIDVSVSSFDRYECMGSSRLEMVTRASDYLPAVDRALQGVGEKPGLVLYNAGMDPHEDSACGFPGIRTEHLERREERVFGWCREQGIPVAFVLAGGYLSERLDRDGLVALHRITLRCASGVSG